MGIFRRDVENNSSSSSSIAVVRCCIEGAEEREDSIETFFIVFGTIVIVEAIGDIPTDSS
jgi:hypothetical protein